MAFRTLGVPEMRSPDTSRATRVDRLQRQAATPAFAVTPVAALVPREFSYVAGLSARTIPCPSHDKVTQCFSALLSANRKGQLRRSDNRAAPWIGRIEGTVRHLSGPAFTFHDDQSIYGPVTEITRMRR